MHSARFLSGPFQGPFQSQFQNGSILLEWIVPGMENLAGPSAKFYSTGIRVNDQIPAGITGASQRPPLSLYICNTSAAKTLTITHGVSMMTKVCPSSRRSGTLWRQGAHNHSPRPCFSLVGVDILLQVIWLILYYYPGWPTCLWMVLQICFHCPDHYQCFLWWQWFWFRLHQEFVKSALESYAFLYHDISTTKDGEVSIPFPK